MSKPSATRSASARSTVFADASVSPQAPAAKKISGAEAECKDQLPLMKALVNVIENSSDIDPTIKADLKRAIQALSDALDELAVHKAVVQAKAVVTKIAAMEIIKTIIKIEKKDINALLRVVVVAEQKANQMKPQAECLAGIVDRFEGALPPTLCKKEVIEALRHPEVPTLIAALSQVEAQLKRAEEEAGIPPEERGKHKDKLCVDFQTTIGRLSQLLTSA